MHQNMQPKHDRGARDGHVALSPSKKSQTKKQEDGYMCHIEAAPWARRVCLCQRACMTACMVGYDDVADDDDDLTNSPSFVLYKLHLKESSQSSKSSFKAVR